MRPIGPSSKMFRSHMGVLCHEHAKFTCGMWSPDPADKAHIYYQITEKYDIDMDAIDVWIGLEKWLAKLFRHHKYRMHQHFKSYGNNIEDARRNPYENVKFEVWQDICDIFMQQKFKERSRINIVNKSKNLTNHCAGSKPFVVLRHELRNPETQEEPDMVTFYEHAHRKDNGKGAWVTARCEALHADMTQRLESQPSDETSPSSSYSIRNQVFYDVVGRRSGYVNGLGHGEMPITLSRCSQEDFTEARQRSARLEEQLREQAQIHQAERDEQRASIAALQSQLANLSSVVQKLLASQTSSMGDTHPT